jgi:hypothetical protein
VAAGYVPGKNPRPFGNAVFVDLAAGESWEYQGKQVTLVSIEGSFSTIEVDGARKRLIVARRALPEVVGGVRVFVADNRSVRRITTDAAWPQAHGATTRDALVCLSDPAKPLLDPERFTFPVSRSDGFQWTMEENSHSYAYLLPTRSHEGIDVDMHDARGRDVHALVAIEAGTVRWVDTSNSDPNQACILLESAVDPGTYYVYQHLNRRRVLVRAGQTVAKGEPLGYVWGDRRWGHLHFSVVGYGAEPAYKTRYRHLLNVFPMLCELWQGDLSPRPKTWARGRFVFDRPYWTGGNFKRLSGYDGVVGYGWLLDPWCAARMVERMPGSETQNPQNARLAKVLHQGTPAEAANPKDHYDFEVAVEDGEYVVSARVGDRLSPSWQRVQFESLDAGTYRLDAGRFAWTPEKTVRVADGKLTVRIHLKDRSTRAGLSQLDFQRR